MMVAGILLPVTLANAQSTGINGSALNLGERLGEQTENAVGQQFVLPVVRIERQTTKADLQGLYSKYLRDPMVDVAFVVDNSPGAVSPWGFVTVMGCVKQPGRINMPPTQDLTLSMAIQQAGGFDSSAKERSIVITRKDRDGNTEKLKADMRDIASKGQTDLPLRDGDVIFVPERFF